MLSVLRVGCLGFVVAILLLTVTARAYFYGPWPTSFVCTIDGPPGARVVRVDGQSCDHPVPHRVSRFRAWLQDPNLCPIELEHAGRRLRGRVVVNGTGGFKTGHMAFLGPVESRDGSAWLHEDFNHIEILAPEPGGSWFACAAWGRTPLVANGVEIDASQRHFVPLVVGEGRTNEIHCDQWSLHIEADAGCCVQLTEWGGTEPLLRLRLDDSGFDKGTIHVDDVAQVLTLGSEQRFVGRQYDVRLASADGADSARVRLQREPRDKLRLTLRISRDH